MTITAQATGDDDRDAALARIVALASDLIASRPEPADEVAAELAALRKEIADLRDQYRHCWQPHVYYYPSAGGYWPVTITSSTGTYGAATAATVTATSTWPGQVN